MYNLNSGVQRDIGSKKKSNKDLLKKYKLHGYFMANKDLMLYSSNPNHPQKHGYAIFSAFKTDANKVILIKRGWLGPHDLENFIKKKNSVSKEKQYITLALVPYMHEERSEMPKPYQKNNSRNIWFTLNLPEIKKSMSLEMETGYYGLMVEGELVAKMFEKGPVEKNININKNHHIWYSIMWFFLAISSLLIGYKNYRNFNF